MPRHTKEESADWNSIVTATVRDKCLAMAWVPVTNCVLGTQIRLIVKDLDSFMDKPMKGGFNPNEKVYLMPSTDEELGKLKEIRKEVRNRAGNRPLSMDEYPMLPDDYVSEENSIAMSSIKYKIIDGAHRITWMQRNMLKATDQDKESWKDNIQKTHAMAMILDSTGVDTVKLAYALNQVTHTVVPLSSVTGRMHMMAKYLQVSNSNFCFQPVLSIIYPDWTVCVAGLHRRASPRSR